MRHIVLPARTDVLVEFYFSAPHLLERHDTLTRERAPTVAAVGPQTFRRVDLILAGAMDIFTAHFSPTGLHALLGVPMSDLADAGLEAAVLFGERSIQDLRHHLAEAGDFATRAWLMDAFLLARLDRRASPRAHRAVTGAVAGMKRGANASVGMLASEAGLSERQFRRLFEQQVGVAPKLYSRIVRLEAALAAKTLAPERSWADVAHGLGWFDQAHMDKDFLALAGSPPSQFVAMRRQAAMAGSY